MEEPVDFPMLLDILPVVHTSHRGQSSTTYDCISIIEHIGNTLGVGHCITKNRRHNSNDWISHDDTKITEVPRALGVVVFENILHYNHDVVKACQDSDEQSLHTQR